MITARQAMEAASMLGKFVKHGQVDDTEGFHECALILCAKHGIQIMQRVKVYAARGVDGDPVNWWHWSVHKQLVRAEKTWRTIQDTGAEFYKGLDRCRAARTTLEALKLENTATGLAWAQDAMDGGGR